MKLVKGIFVLVLVVVTLVAGLKLAYDRGLINAYQLESANPAHLLTQITSKFNGNNNSKDESQEEVTTGNSSNQLFLSAQKQGSTLLERGKDMTTQTQKVLGTYISPAETDDDQALHEKALEYGQYLYCQQVVIDYEKRHPAE